MLLLSLSQPTKTTGMGGLSSSFLALKAEVERSKAEQNVAGSSKRKKPIDDVTSRSSKKKPTTSAPAGVVDPFDKVAAQAEHRHSSSPSAKQLALIRSNLERKARIYDRLSAGNYAEISKEEMKEGSIDWDAKRLQPCAPEPDTVEAEEQVEYVDEFGRTRLAPISEVPREFLPTRYGGDKEEEEGGEDNAVYGRQESFPVYDPSVHRREKERQGEKEREQHMAAKFETRHRGPAFYKFSSDHAQRDREMKELQQLRDETISHRKHRNKHKDS